jgi:hypothetical protein
MHSSGGGYLDERDRLEVLDLDGIIQLDGSSRNGSARIEFG